MGTKSIFVEFTAKRIATPIKIKTKRIACVQYSGISTLKGRKRNRIFYSNGVILRNV